MKKINEAVLEKVWLANIPNLAYDASWKMKLSNYEFWSIASAEVFTWSVCGLSEWNSEAEVQSRQLWKGYGC